MEMPSVDAMKLAERLQGLRREEHWLHLEAKGPFEKYPAKQHALRVRDKLDVGEGLIYLPGAPARNNEDSDMPAPFRQRRYFYYLSGCNEPSCHVTYDIKQDVLTLFIPRINPDRVFWNGRGSTPAEALDKYDVDEVFYVDQLESWIQDWFLHYRYNERLYVLHEEQVPNLPRFPWPLDSSSLLPAINLCRMIKDDHEIKLIRKANDISSEAHKQILANITRFKNEAQVEGLFLNVCISKQAKQQAYDPIAASGPNAGTLHYDANNEDFEDRQLMCLDAGCEYELYASDITRTFPLSGSWPSQEAADIYKLVERMQESCIAKLAPGVRYLDLHILAHQVAIDGLLGLGILHNGTREEIYKAGTSKAFFPHGLGHHVGLEVHDVGQQELMSLYKNPKYEKAPSLYPEDFHVPVYDADLCMAPTDPQSPHLEEGMVVTVEPGIYFSAYVLSYFYLPSPVHSKYINTKVLYRYFPVGGVRIEDDLLITRRGYENLTTAPKGEAMLDIIRSRGVKPPCVTRRISPSVVPQVASEEPLRRAPGIPKRVAEPLLKPVARAATEPVKSTAGAEMGEKNTERFWWFQFDSKSTSTTEPGSRSRAQKQQPLRTQDAPSAHHTNSQVSLCGNRSEGVKHLWMGWQQHASGEPAAARTNWNEKPAPRCMQCVVLSETVDRLRDTLSRSKRTSPQRPKSPHAPTPMPSTLPPAPSPPMEKAPEMRQTARPPAAAPPQVRGYNFPATVERIPPYSSEEPLDSPPISKTSMPRPGVCTFPPPPFFCRAAPAPAPRAFPPLSTASTSHPPVLKTHPSSSSSSSSGLRNSGDKELRGKMNSSLAAASVLQARRQRRRGVAFEEEEEEEGTQEGEAEAHLKGLNPWFADGVQGRPRLFERAVGMAPSMSMGMGRARAAEGVLETGLPLPSVPSPAVGVARAMPDREAATRTRREAPNNHADTDTKTDTDKNNISNSNFSTMLHHSPTHARFHTHQKQQHHQHTTTSPTTPLSSPQLSNFTTLLNHTRERERAHAQRGEVSPWRAATAAAASTGTRLRRVHPSLPDLSLRRERESVERDGDGGAVPGEGEGVGVRRGEGEGESTAGDDGCGCCCCDAEAESGEWVDADADAT